MTQAPLYLLASAGEWQDDIPVDKELESEDSESPDDIIETSGGSWKYGYVPDEM